MFIPVKYGNKNYPEGITPKIWEVAGHFDKEPLKFGRNYSLHTEYSFTSRKMNSEFIKEFPEILKATANYIPMLWHNKEWAIEFAMFVLRITENVEPPKIIEIHPPFNDYCVTMADFFEVYKVFEDVIMNKYPQTKIVIENRSGSQYRGGEFLLSTKADLLEFCEAIIRADSSLRIVLDIQQLITAEKIGINRFPIETFESLMKEIKVCMSMIDGVHVWARRKNATGRWVSHNGNLDDMFSEDVKRRFIKAILDATNDGMDRYFVPEVNSSEDDLKEIINDFVEAGARFA